MLLCGVLDVCRRVDVDEDELEHHGQRVLDDQKKAKEHGEHIDETRTRRGGARECHEHEHVDDKKKAKQHGKHVDENELELERVVDEDKSSVMASVSMRTRTSSTIRKKGGARTCFNT